MFGRLWREKNCRVNEKMIIITTLETYYAIYNRGGSGTLPLKEQTLYNNT